MNLKCLFLICAVVNEVRSDCDDYFKCLGEFIRDFFESDQNSTQTETYINNNSDANNFNDSYINIDRKRNVSINIFDITDLEKNLSKVLTDVTSLIKDEVEGKLKIESESETFKTFDNKTEIHIKAIDFDKVPAEVLRNIDLIKIKNETDVLNQPKGAKNFGESVIPSIKEDFIINVPETLNTNVTVLNRLGGENITSKIPIIVFNDNSTPENDDRTSTQNPFKDKVESDASLFGTIVNESGIYIEPIYIDILPQNHNNGVNKVQNKEFTEKLDYKTESDQPLHVDFITKGVLNEKDIKLQRINNSKTETQNIFNLQIPSTAQKAIEIKLSTDGKTPNGLKIVNTSDVKTSTNILQATNLIKDLLSGPNQILFSNNAELKTITYDVTTSIDTHTTNTKDVDFFDLKTEDHTLINFNRVKNVEENEISKDQDFESYYDVPDDNSTDYPIIDYIELYKDTTNEELYYKPTDPPTNISEGSDLDNAIDYRVPTEDSLGIGGTDNANYSESITSSSEVFSWIATIFVKNGSSNQFDYFCDGAILSNKIILTAARCVHPSNATAEAGNLIIILGKRSLQATAPGERVHRVKQIKLHENFTNSHKETANDLAILVLVDEISFSDSVQAARMPNGEDGEFGEAITTGWAYSGNVTAIHFDKDKSKNCKKNSHSLNTFCATYDKDVSFCPSHGGLYFVILNNRWTLQGLRTADTMDRTFCIDKTVVFTTLYNYAQWIAENVVANKNI